MQIEEQYLITVSKLYNLLQAPSANSQNVFPMGMCDSSSGETKSPRRRSESSVILMDVRPALDFYDRGHIRSAKNHPLPDKTMEYEELQKIYKIILLDVTLGSNYVLIITKDGNLYPNVLNLIYYIHKSGKATNVKLLYGGYQEFEKLYPFLCLSSKTSQEDFLKTHDKYPHEIIPQFLYMSSYIEASNFQALTALKITHILNVTIECDNKFEGKFEYLKLQIDDSTKEDLFHILQDALAFIDKVKATPNAKILVHCLGGKSRSAAIVIAHLMKTQNMDLKHAVNHVREIRSVINPNKGFLNQLAIYEKKLDGTYVECDLG